MFRKLAAGVSRRPAPFIVAWLALAGALVLLAPPFDRVATQDQTAFLGADAGSVRAARELAELWPRDEFSQAGALVFRRDAGLTEDDRAFVRTTERWANKDGPANVRLTESPFSRPELRDSLVSADGRAMIVVVAFMTAPFEPDTNAAVAAIRDHVQRTAPDGLETHLTGNAGVAADQAAAINEGIHRTTIITIGLVLVILLWIYRSPVTPLIPLTTIGVAFAVAHSLVALLAAAGLKVSSLVETFMVVIIFGAGTDYCLFVVSRYKEELHAHSGDDRRRTLVGTMAVIGGVIASSAATVIVGFGAQGVARFGMFRTMGPAMAVAVAVTLLAGLTLTPALLRVAGRWAFWPQRLGEGTASPALPDGAASRGGTSDGTPAAEVLLGPHPAKAPRPRARRRGHEAAA